MGKGRKAIPPELKDPDAYKNVGTIKRQKEYSIKAGAALKPPKTLSTGAKKEWKRIVDLFNELDVQILNDLDTQILASYCISVDIRNKLYEKWRTEENEELLKNNTTTNASVTTDGKGKATRGTSGNRTKIEVNPILNAIDKYNKTIRVLAEQLALTPASRAAYAVRSEKKNRNELEEFMDDE